MLNGKTKIDFKKWYMYNFDKYKIHLITLHYHNICFYTLPFSMQYGVYVDYFDSVGVEINISPLLYGLTNSFQSRVDNTKIRNHKSRPEARKSAIEKANEIRNKQLSEI